MREYTIQHNIGKAKYVVNYHDGNNKTHNDGSTFYDVGLFSSKKKMQEFIDQLKAIGYVEGAGSVKPTPPRPTKATRHELLVKIRQIAQSYNESEQARLQCIIQMIDKYENPHRYGKGK